MRTLQVAFPDTGRVDRWRVQRAGEPGAWLPGWFAVAPAGEDTAAWFPTHAEAFVFALGRVSAKVADDTVEDAMARWGIRREKPAPKTPRALKAVKTRAAGGRAGAPGPREAEPVRRGRGRPAALTAEQEGDIVSRRAQGESVAVLAIAFSVSTNTVRRALRRAEVAA
jgi:hypothetical protein